MSHHPHRLIRGLHNLPAVTRGSVVTIGTFDGVHLGHQAIIKQVTDQAHKMSLPSVAMIFEPQPQEYFCGQAAPARLMRFREKVLALFAAGIDQVLCVPFNDAFRALDAQQFIERVLVDGLGSKYLVVGDDFRFGCDRSGDYQRLQEAGERHGFAVTDTHTLEFEGERISSTRVRSELEAGRFDSAADLLGKPYAISGRVIYGQQLGRQLGVPTANVLLRRYRSPLQGVFAIRAQLAQGQGIAGVANVGVRPTVGAADRPILEVHLFDFSRDIYGQNLEVEFCHKLREEQKFDSLDQLKAQIYADIAAAKRFLNH